MRNAVHNANHLAGLSRTQRGVVLGVALWLIAGGAEQARAATYTAWQCRDGSNDETAIFADWSWSASGRGSYSYGNSTACRTVVPEYGPVPLATMVLPVADNNPNLVVEDMTAATARTGLTLIGARLWWRGALATGGQVAAIATRSDGSQQTLLDRRATFPTSGSPDRAADPNDTLDLGSATALTLRAACLGSCTSAPAPPLTAIAEADLYRAAFTVSDASPPAGSAIGDLLSSKVLVGKQSVTVDAADSGGGVYLARILVDGQVEATGAFGDTRCRDVDASNTDPLEFATIRPCPLHDSTSVVLDSTALSEDSYHDISIQVMDAAGNVTDIARRRVGVDNAPLAPGFFDRASRHFLNPVFNIGASRQRNGAGAASGAILRVYLPVVRTVRVKRGRHKGQQRRVTRANARRTVHYEGQPQLTAVLTDVSRHPIARATVWTALRIEGSDWRIAGRPHVTTKTGRVRFQLPAKAPSRQVNVVYFPFSDSHEQAVGRPVKLIVRSGVHLQLSAHHLHNGERVYFRGSVEGLQPGRGVTADLQVKQGTRYRTFRQIRVRPAADGRFRTAYRFTATQRRTRYRFRLVVLKQEGLPFARGTSEVGSVVVSP